jgi:hypothetical protein
LARKKWSSVSSIFGLCWRPLCGRKVKRERERVKT